MAEVERQRAEAEEEEEERETHRPRQVDEEELPTYAAALSAARKEGPRGAAA